MAAEANDAVPLLAEKLGPEGVPCRLRRRVVNLPVELDRELELRAEKIRDVRADGGLAPELGPETSDPAEAPTALPRPRSIAPAARGPGSASRSRGARPNCSAGWRPEAKKGGAARAEPSPPRSPSPNPREAHPPGEGEGAEKPNRHERGKGWWRPSPGGRASWGLGEGMGVRAHGGAEGR